MAHDFAKLGAQVILSARRVEQLESVKASVIEAAPAYTPAPYVLPLDVTDLEAQKVAVKEVEAKFGNIDIMVLNAGQSQRILAMDLPFEKFQQLMHLNVDSVVHMSQLVVPSMIERKSGQVC